MERLDRLHHGTQPGEVGPLVSRLQEYGELQGLVAGAWADGSRHLHDLIDTCVDSQVQHLIRSTGQMELEGQRSVLTGQFRRLVSVCVVRSQAKCLISRIGVISPEARAAAGRRDLAARLEREMRQERTAQWIATMAGPGWGRRGNCHTLG